MAFHSQVPAPLNPLGLFSLFGLESFTAFLDETAFYFYFLFFSGNDALDKAVKANEAKESFQKYPQATGRLASFTRNFLRNIQNEIEKSQRGQR